jgi:phytoene desaturase
MSNSKNAIIIGSGVGGLAMAIRLAVKGYTVSVYEKNNMPGGKLHAFNLNGFKFDAGPSLFTQPQNLIDLFNAASEDINDYLTYKAVENSCTYFFADGTKVNAYTNLKMLATELQSTLNVPASATITYLQRANDLYKNIGTIFLNHSLHKTKTWFNKKIVNALRVVRLSYLTKTLHKYNQQYFKNTKAEQIFNRFATYNGSNPYSAPAMLSMIPHLELNEGTYYPNGGMVSITNALFTLAQKKGVQFFFNTNVTSIINNGKKVLGITVDNKNILANVVVSNADIFFTYSKLLQAPIKAKKVLKQERSSSAIVFYWAVNKNIPNLGLHNIIFSNNYKAEFEHIFKFKSVATDCTIYINITSKEDPTQAPSGTENWFVMVNAPANIGQNWQALIQQIRPVIIAKINATLAQHGFKINIEDFIVAEEILEPQGIEAATQSYMGSLYGTSSNSRFAAFLRHPNKSRQFNNLYFVGGSVHPGGGIPLCLKSAQIAADLVC